MITEVTKLPITSEVMSHCSFVFHYIIKQLLDFCDLSSHKDAKLKFLRFQCLQWPTLIRRCLYLEAG
jgi:hypothetical protein